MEKIVAVLERRDLFVKQFELKQAALEALARLGAKQSLTAVRRVARTWLMFGPRAGELRRLAALTADIIEGQRPLPPRGFEHHANYNLSGYPRLVAKDLPHPLARLIQIADFYDAAVASTGRARGRMLPYLAVRFIIDGAGRTFDPMLARVFQQVLGTYPIGSVVELSSGEIAVVQRPSDRDAERPVVKVVADRKGPAEPRVVDLEEALDPRIVRGLAPEDVGIDARAHV